MNRKGKFKVSKKNKSGRFNGICLGFIKAHNDLSALSRKIVSNKIDIRYISTNNSSGKDAHPTENIISVSFIYDGLDITIDDYRRYGAGFIRIYCRDASDKPERIRIMGTLSAGIFEWEIVQLKTIDEYTTSSNLIELNCNVKDLPNLSEEEYFQESLLTPNLDDIIKQYKTMMYFFKCIKPKTCLMNIVRDL